MKIEGTIESIIYSNQENGYTIIKFITAENTEITAVGIFANPVEGALLALEGKWINNSKFGSQFEVEKAYPVEPVGKMAIFKYLSSGMFKGVGMGIAQLIVDTYGTKSLEIIENQPEELAKIRGISLKRAYEISAVYRENVDMNATMLYLQNLGLGIGTALKLYKAHGNDIKNILESEPYRLIDEIDGIGFATADKLALKCGFAKDSRERIEAAIVYVLNSESSRYGHTYLPFDILIEMTCEQLEFNVYDYSDIISEAINACSLKGDIVFFKKDDHIAVQSRMNYTCELNIALNIKKLLEEPMIQQINIDSEISQYEKEQNIILHDLQKEAILNCIKYGLSIVSGGPGTGKTTIIKCVLGIFEKLDYSVALCAPTGRAAKRLNEATFQEAKTIHRMLGYDFVSGKFDYNRNNKLEQDIIIVDEVSMCDIYIFNALLQSIKKGARVIIIGDKDQLPSVGCGNILADIIRSEKVPVNYLTQIYRQEEGSLIISNAHLINRGKMPVFDNKSKDFFFSERANAEDILNDVINMATVRIPKYKKVDCDKIQILCPVKKGVAGVDNVNSTMQEVLNPKSVDKSELAYKGKLFREGDRIIHMVNNYQMEWVNTRDNTSGIGVFNGDIGKIITINKTSRYLTVLFDDGRTSIYQSGDLEEISLAYAISVHKAQGSEFDIVILPITGNYRGIMTRNLLYTAVTRAKNMVVLIGQKSDIQSMVSNNYTARRYTLLYDFLLQECK